MKEKYFYDIWFWFKVILIILFGTSMMLSMLELIT